MADVVHSHQGTLFVRAAQLLKILLSKRKEGEEEVRDGGDKVVCARVFEFRVCDVLIN